MDVREKLVELFYDNNVICDQKIEGLADDVMDIIDNGVTAVVRCKDCIYSYEEFGFIYCTFGPYGDCAVPSQFYCAEGKRKEDK